MVLIPFKPTALAIITMGLASTLIFPEASGATISVSPGDTTQLDGTVDHSGDTVEMTGGNLLLKQSLHLGGDGISPPSISMSGGSLMMEGGASMAGQLLIRGTSAANIGTTGGGPAAFTDLLASGQASIALDNVTVGSGHPVFTPPDSTGVLILHDQSHVSATSRTVIAGNSEQTAVWLFDNSSADLNGSTITSGMEGIAIQDNSRATLTGGSIVAAGGGVTAVGNAQLTVSGSSITVTNTRAAGTGVGALQDFDAFGAIIYGGDKVSGEAPTLTLSDTTLQVKAGLKNTGLGLVASNASHPVMNVNNSSVHADGYGAVFDADPTGTSPGTGTSTLNVNNSTIQSDTKAAIWVQQNTRAVINLSGKATRLLAGAGQSALQTDAGSTTAVTVNNADIAGDLVNTGGNTSLTLGNAGSWTGTFTGLTSLTTQAGGQATLTGNSSITGNVSNSGTIALNNGGVGNTLTVNGNYTGNGGALLFNSALAGDSSLTDKLVVKGNAAGTTNVSVTNAGGTGAQTLDGIKLIEVDGTSAAGAFKQQGRIVAGAYDYTLNAHGNSWYLDSRLSPGPVPPVPPKPVIHVVRPEAGSYIANQAASSMFLTTLHDRAGENRYMNTLNTDGSVSSLWLRQVGVHNQFHDGSGQLRTTGNTYVAQLGGDLTQWSSNDRDRFHLGVMAGYGNNHNNTHSTVSGHGSKGSVDGYSVGMYGTWYQNDQADTGAWVDGQLMYSWFNNHVNGEGISEESYKSKGLTASVETGYTFALGESGPQANRTAYFIEPQAQVTWMGVKSGDVTEANGTRVSAEGENNVQTRLGARAFLRGHNQMDSGKDRNFQPFVKVNWLHNTKRNGVVMNGVSLEQAGAVNVGEVKLGVEGQLSRQTALWGNVGQQLGDKGYSNTATMVGIKYSF
ncbi:autotransporter outer membrane beta-barrel domain-containing protein [Cedecea neteri]|uniref:autotransporter outer membrane beta-barrel domain-containing protein n=1 Tax=Cedecea neteri TaxID=158822 RepID=UPI000772F4EB|nr:autotransporter outer membrane beta-barrel domain-containing protein [Cedecea neteri]